MIDIAVLILRIGLGVVFVAHGLQAVLGLFGGGGLNGFANMLSGLGFQPPFFWACVGAFTELIGGVFVLLGILPRTAAFFILIFMAVAVFKVHMSKGFFIQVGGFEYNFLIICACLALMILGAGKYSIFDKF
jgi:putative oxidoreductase